MVHFYGFHASKYTVHPMDPSWDLNSGCLGVPGSAPVVEISSVRCTGGRCNPKSVFFFEAQNFGSIKR